MNDLYLPPMRVGNSAELGDILLFIQQPEGERPPSIEELRFRKMELDLLRLTQQYAMLESYTLSRRLRRMWLRIKSWARVWRWGH